MAPYILWANDPFKAAHTPITSLLKNKNEKQTVQTVAEVLRYTGGNSGNLIYVQGLRNILPTATGSTPWTVCPNSADKLIFPGANQLSTKTDLGNLKKSWEAFDANIIVIGLGIQSKVGELPNLTKGTKEWLDFLVKCTENAGSFIGVRGKTTEQFINKLYNNSVAKVVGCPSQFISTPDYLLESLSAKISKPLKTLAVNACDPSWDYFYSYERKFANEIINNDGCYIVQASQEHIIAALLVSPVDVDANYDIAHIKMAEIASTAFFKNYSRFFVNASDWLACVKNYDYSVGCRIHGCMASLAAGVPSFLFTIDARTKEFAEAMQLPYTDDLNLSAPIEVAKHRLMNFDYGNMINTWKKNAQVVKELFDINTIEVSEHFTEHWLK